MDNQEGVGTEKWPDGTKFSGNYKSGVKKGFGIQIWNDRSTFSGGFEDD